MNDGNAQLGRVTLFCVVRDLIDFLFFLLSLLLFRQVVVKANWWVFTTVAVLREGGKGKGTNSQVKYLAANDD